MANTSTPGMCPYYKPTSKCCHLTGSLQSQSQRDGKCATKDNWTRCGNYEAKIKGSNYKNK